MSGKRSSDAKGSKAKKPRRSRRLAPRVATVIVRNLLGAVQAELEVALDSSVRSLRRVVARNARLSVDEVKLMYDDREMRADDQLSAWISGPAEDEEEEARPVALSLPLQVYLRPRLARTPSLMTSLS